MGVPSPTPWCKATVHGAVSVQTRDTNPELHFPVGGKALPRASASATKRAEGLGVGTHG